MSRHPQSITFEEFSEYVRSALSQLYDSVSLQKHPLAEMLIDDESRMLDCAQSLRRVFLEAIRAARPAAGTPARSPDWRAYRVLELRYVDGLSPDEAMDQLALGKSQFFRDQSRALRILIDYLWDHYLQMQRETPHTVDSVPSSEGGLIQSEVDRLLAEATREEVDAGQLLIELRTVLSELASVSGTSVQIGASHHLGVVQGSRVLLRQTILNVVSYALKANPGASLEVSTFAEQPEVGIRIRAYAPEGLETPTPTLEYQEVRLDICARLMASMGGSVHLSTEEAPWEVRLVWQAPMPCTLLAIDDNEGYIELFRRYLTGHKWQVTGATDGANARRLITEVRPTVITLDVLMPQEDGWELLNALKANAKTRDIPIIVCSVLREPQLALSLGATAYLPKPVTEQSLLRALAPWSEASATLAPKRSD